LIPCIIVSFWQLKHLHFRNNNTNGHCLFLHNKILAIPKST
jgi:hypothetical protein